MLNRTFRWIYTGYLILAAPLLFSQQLSQKIFISKFIQADNDSNYSYFALAIPRSINATLRDRTQIQFKPDEISNSTLKSLNFNFQLKGRYNVKDGSMLVTFSLLNLKNNKVNIIAVAKGYPDHRIFTLIDALCKLVADTLAKPESEYIHETVILSIDPEGRISVSRTDSLSGLDLSYTNLQGINLSGRNLSGINFTGADLSNSNLSRANIAGTNFTDINFQEMKSFKYNLYIEKAIMSPLMMDQVYVHDFLVGPKIGLGSSLLYRATGSLYDLLSWGVKSKSAPGFNYSISAMGFYFFTKLFGIYFDVGWYHVITKEKVPPGGTVLTETIFTYSMAYAHLSIAPAIRFNKWYFYAGLYTGFPVLFNHKVDLYELRKPDFGLTTGIGTRIRLKLKMYLYIGLEYKLQLIRWGKSDAVIGGICGGSYMTLTISASLLFGLK